MYCVKGLSKETEYTTFSEIFFPSCQNYSDMLDLVVAKLCCLLDCNRCYTECCPQGYLRCLIDPDASSDEGMEVGTVVVLLVGKTVNTPLDSSNASSDEISSDITVVMTEVSLVLVAGRKSVEAPEDPNCVSLPTSD